MRSVLGAHGRVGGGCGRDGEAEAVPGTGESKDPGSRGQASGCGTTIPVGRRWTLEELHASEHAIPAVGTETQSARQEIEEPLPVLSVLGVQPGDRLRLTESVPAAGEELGPAAVSEKAVVPDPYEALGEDVEEETAGELPKRKGESSDPLAAVLLETERDGPVVDLKQPVVGDRDAVCIATEVLQNLLGAVEGRLGIDNPFGAPCLVEEAVERCRAPVGNEAAVQLQPSVPERLGEPCQELATEETAEHTDG